MFKNANILYEIKNSKRRRYYAKFQDLALKRRREIFYEMDPRRYERESCTCNSLHNTKTRQKAFKKILWRLLWSQKIWVHAGSLATIASYSNLIWALTNFVVVQNLLTTTKKNCANSGKAQIVTSNDYIAGNGSF